MTTPTLHASLGELDRASTSAIASLEKRGLGEPALALRIAVDHVRSALASTLPAPTPRGSLETPASCSPTPIRSRGCTSSTALPPAPRPPTSAPADAQPGKEAEELRAGVERLVRAAGASRKVHASSLEALLDRVDARDSLAEVELQLDARRYQRLRLLGCAPSSTPQLENRTCLCFQNLDDFVDADLKAKPDRGEAKGVFDQPWVTEIKRDLEKRVENRPAERRSAPSSSDVDHIDSGMKPGERGTPYTIEEARAVASAGNMDGYHQEVMQFLVRRVDRLEQERVKDLNVLSAQAKIDTAHNGTHYASDQRAATEALAAAKTAGDDPQRWAQAFVTALKHIGCANAHDLRFVTNWFLTAIDAVRRVDEDRRAEAQRKVDQAKAIDDHDQPVSPAFLAYSAPPNIPAAPPPETERFDDSRQKRLSRVQLAIDDVRTAITLVALEADPSVATELERRVDVMIDAFHRLGSGPSAELVGLRFFHDNVTAWVRTYRSADGSVSLPAAFAGAVLDNGGELLMKPPEVTRRADGAYVVGPPPDGKTVEQRCDELMASRITSGSELDLQAAEAAANMILKQIDDMGFLPPEAGSMHTVLIGYVCAELDKLIAALKIQRQPGTFVAAVDDPKMQRVIDKARRLVSRGIHNRRTLDELARGAVLSLLHNDLQGLMWLADAVAELDGTKKG